MRSNYRYTLRHGWGWLWDDLKHYKPLLAMRTLYWALLRGWDGETCQFCGRPYILWRAPDAIWRAVMGTSFGLSCPSCFDSRARVLGTQLHWAPEPLADYFARLEAR